MIKSGGSKSLSHTWWSGGRGYLRRGTRRRDESVRGECVIFLLDITSNPTSVIRVPLREPENGFIGGRVCLLSHNLFTITTGFRVGVTNL